MKLFAAAAMVMTILGFAGAASAQCSWSSSKTTTAETDPVIVLPSTEESLGS